MHLPINRSYWDSLSEDELKVFVDEIYSHYRLTGFPFHKKTLFEQKQSLKDLDDYLFKNLIIKGNIIQQSMHCLSTAWTYFPHAWEVRCSKMKTPMEVFNDNVLFKKLIKSS